MTTFFTICAILLALDWFFSWLAYGPAPNAAAIAKYHADENKFYAKVCAKQIENMGRVIDAEIAAEIAADKQKKVCHEL